MKIMAVGNAFYGDDGIGAAVLDRLSAEGVPSGVNLLDLGTDALAIIEHLEPGRRHIVVDAARMDTEPGTVVAFHPAEVRLRLRSDRLSMHGFGLAEAFDLAARLKCLPNDLLIIGIEPEHVDADCGLSETVAAAVPRVVDIIRQEVLRHERADGSGH